jgi:outer membrane protein assembly factor BamA
VRRAAGALLLVASGAAAAGPPLAAQRYWRNTLYPYFYYSSVDGWWFGGRFGVYSPIGYRERPERNQAEVRFDASASTAGSYRLLIDAQAPAWWDGWRAGLTLAAVRANRLGYFGLGNATPYEADSVNATDPFFYAVGRTTQQVRLTVQRRVVPRLRALAGLVYEHTDYRGLPGATVFERDLASGALDSSQVKFRDLVVRAGLVLDTRDNETDPHRGLFVEALYGRGEDYSRATVQARGFLQPVERLTLAARVAGERMGRDPPLAPLTLMESSELPFVAVGGYYSLRGFYDGRFAGPHKLVGGLEARYGLLWAPTLFELKLVAFYDVGRVFGPGEGFSLTTRGLHATGGGEVAARFGRNGLIVVGAGFGSEGGQFLFGTNWSY